jgi:tartrate/fumarate subfamily iron-sulfur-dependent hydro-lyase beta chain
LLGYEKGKVDMVAAAKIKLPLSAEAARALRAGDLVEISGSMVTGRDRIHKYLAENRPPQRAIPFSLAGTILYHCGPVMKKLDHGYRVIAAGPTTSMRVEMYEAEIIRGYGIRGVMGKGGMGEKTRQALAESSCVYLHTIGGAAVYLADRIKKTHGAWMLEEFGPTEAMWLFEVEDFPAMVTMDCHGGDLHREIEKKSKEKFAELIGK